MMEKHGLIRVVATRVVSGILEKTYRATAYLFMFDQSIFASAPTDPSSLPPGIALTFETTKNQLEQSLESGVASLAADAPRAQQVESGWRLSRMTPAQAEQFYARFNDLLNEFEALDEDPTNAEAQTYRLFFTLFPVQARLRTPKGKPRAEQ